MYGVLSADITFIGMFFCTLIISVIFYRLNETSPTNVTQEPQVKDFVDKSIEVVKVNEKSHIQYVS